MARPTCLSWLRHRERREASRAACTAGKSSATKSPMMAMTTNSSTSVNPRLSLDIVHPDLSKELFQLKISFVAAASLGHLDLERGLQIVFGRNPLLGERPLIAGRPLDFLLLAAIGRRDHH